MTPCTVIIIPLPVWNFIAGYKVKLTFSGAFAKLRKATISFVMSVGTSVCPSVRTKQHIFYVKKIIFEKRAVCDVTWKYNVELDRP